MSASPRKQRCAFGIDIGGTSIKIGLVASSGEIIKRTKLVPTSKTEPELLYEEISAAMQSLLDGLCVPRGIGIGVPGYADPSSGILVDGSGNVPALRKSSIVEYLRSRFMLPTFIGNDGVCAAIGEQNFGIGQTTDSFVFLGLGTGVGGAIIWKGKVLDGFSRKPPEFGAVVVRPGDGAVRHGIAGSVENTAGARAMIRRYASKMGEENSQLSVQDLFELANLDDVAAKEVIDDMYETVAQLLGTIINLTGIEVCVIGGGISSAGQELLDGIRSRLSKNTWPSLLENCELHLARCGNSAGMKGAAQLYLENADRELELN